MPKSNKAEKREWQNQVLANEYQNNQYGDLDYEATVSYDEAIAAEKAEAQRWNGLSYFEQARELAYGRQRRDFIQRTIDGRPIRIDYSAGSFNQFQLFNPNNPSEQILDIAPRSFEVNSIALSQGEEIVFHTNFGNYTASRFLDNGNDILTVVGDGINNDMWLLYNNTNRDRFELYDSSNQNGIEFIATSSSTLQENSIVYENPITPSPTQQPTNGAPTAGTNAPIAAPTTAPTAGTNTPTTAPIAAPTAMPSRSPFASPTSEPTRSPSASPTDFPTRSPIASPTAEGTRAPSSAPTNNPTFGPTRNPTESTAQNSNNANNNIIPIVIAVAVVAAVLAIVALIRNRRKEQQPAIAQEVVNPVFAAPASGGSRRRGSTVSTATMRRRPSDVADYSVASSSGGVKPAYNTAEESIRSHAAHQKDETPPPPPPRGYELYAALPEAKLSEEHEAIVIDILTGYLAQANEPMQENATKGSVFRRSFTKTRQPTPGEIESKFDKLITQQFDEELGIYDIDSSIARGDLDRLIEAAKQEYEQRQQIQISNTNVVTAADIVDYDAFAQGHPNKSSDPASYAEGYVAPEPYHKGQYHNAGMDSAPDYDAEAFEGFEEGKNVEETSRRNTILGDQQMAYELARQLADPTVDPDSISESSSKNQGEEGGYVYVSNGEESDEEKFDGFGPDNTSPKPSLRRQRGLKVTGNQQEEQLEI